MTTTTHSHKPWTDKGGHVTITENGVLRIMSKPSYPINRPTVQVAERMAKACRHGSPLAWNEQVSQFQAGLISWGRVMPPARSPAAICSRLPWRTVAHL